VFSKGIPTVDSFLFSQDWLDSFLTASSTSAIFRFLFLFSFLFCQFMVQCGRLGWLCQLLSTVKILHIVWYHSCQFYVSQCRGFGVVTPKLFRQNHSSAPAKCFFTQGLVSHQLEQSLSYKRVFIKEMTAIITCCHVTYGKVYIFSLPLGGVQSIVMSMSVCLSVCLCARWHNSKTTLANFCNFLCMLPIALARSSSGRIVIRYVLPVYFRMSLFYIMALGTLCVFFKWQ